MRATITTLLPPEQGFYLHNKNKQTERKTVTKLTKGSNIADEFSIVIDNVSSRS